LTLKNSFGDPPVPTNARIADEVKFTTCYMCACRCGIKVSLRDGAIRYIEGNRRHPVNRGVLCAKGSAGIMQHYSPARLRKPLLRTGERGSGQFREIEWEEALTIATGWLGKIRATDPKKLAFFTGRDQSQALTGWWATQFGTANYAAHGGFCSVNMAAGGLYTVGGSFWEFGEPDWDHAKYFMLFGVAEDHDSNPIKIGLRKLKGRGAKVVSVNPIRTGYSAIADEWIGIRPGTDGLFVLALVHELLRAGKIDADYLARYTNSSWLVIQDPGAADDGMFARVDGAPQVLDRKSKAIVSALDPNASPSLRGEAILSDGRRAVPAFVLIAARYLDPKYSPDAVAAKTGLKAATIRRIAAELAHVAFEQPVVIQQKWTDWAGRQHDTMIGRPISIHAMRGISAHSNGFHTCRALHLLQTILGAIDTPGAFRYEPPFPKPIPPAVKPSAHADANASLKGPPLGFPQGPEDLLVDANGEALRIDKAFSWEAPLAAHGMMHTVIANAHRGDPYPIDTLFLYMANMAWNSAMNTAETMQMLTDKDATTGEYKIPRIIYSDAYYSEMVAYADLVLPDTTYLERYDCISLLDRPISNAESAGDAIRQPVVKPDRDVRPFQDVLIDLGARLKLPGLVDSEGKPRYPGFFPDYIVNHDRGAGVGMLAGWRGPTGSSTAIGAVNPQQLDRYIENECFWQGAIPPEAHYFKPWNTAYLKWAVAMGFLAKPEPIFIQLYSETLQKFRLAARGHGKVAVPDRHRQRVDTYFDPLPFWYTPFAEAGDGGDYDFHAVTQRPMAMYHSWGSQNAWLRQIHGENLLHINREAAARYGIADGDWVKVTSEHSTITVQAKLMDGVNTNTVWTWNAIGKRKGAWNLAADAGEVKRGFLLNHLIRDLLPPRDGGYRYANADPVTGQAAWYDLRVRIEKAIGPHDHSEPVFAEVAKPPMPARPKILRYGAKFRPSRSTAKPQ
jgi:anaerobic selenocysteine-containing dehydrogenase